MQHVAPVLVAGIDGVLGWIVPHRRPPNPHTLTASANARERANCTLFTSLMYFSTLV